MKSQQMKHYLLSPLEAELLACYRLLDDQTKDAVANLIGSSVEDGCCKLDNTVELRLVKGA